jgi:hypothetical protein
VQAAAKTFLALATGALAVCRITDAADAGPAVALPDPNSAGVEFFEKRIRPVLIERCYKCHSAESPKLKADLRLDTREGLLWGGESGKPAIVPGHPEASRLIAAIRYADPDLQMPPLKEGKLTDQQIADFVAWVNMGAPDPRTADLSPLASPLSPGTNHWAFQPPRLTPIPAVRNSHWPRTPIDQFILAKLEAKGLSPSPPADKRTLLRRASFDLVGLPPTPEEVEAFLQDTSPRAYEQLIDRLLSSPRYGERWGRYWLDVARYSDTKGYVYDRDEKRFVHSEVYRDWVIRAFNEDLPYDRFLLLQIAADQIARVPSAESGGRNDAPAADASNTAPWSMPNAQSRMLNEDLAAMGFLTLGRRFLGVVHDIIDDRIDVVMRGMQALTVGCARCHDHMYDPISMRDYYALYGVFHSSAEKLVPLGTQPARTKQFIAYEEELRKRHDKLQQTYQAKRAELTDRLRARAADYLAAVLDADKLPTEEFYTIMGKDDLNPVIVRQWQSYLFQTRKAFHPVFALWHGLAALPEKDFAARAPEVLKQFLPEDAGEAGADPAANVPLPLTLTPTPSHGLNRLVGRAFRGPPPTSMREVAARYGRMLSDVDKRWREIVEQSKVENQKSKPDRLPDPDAEQLRQILYGPDSPAHVPEGPIADLEWFFDEGSRVELARRQAEIERWIIHSPGAPPHAVILEDRPNPKNARLFKRGNPANQGEEVPRQFLASLCANQPGTFTLGSGRLELAQAIATTNNPLTARVMVNRVWLHHFGAGLVRTPSDFGTRSEPPSHPELLDWLALRFMQDGWSIKSLHRLIMLSAVYRQASDAEPLKRATVEAGKRQAPAGNRFNDSTVQRFNGGKSSRISEASPAARAAALDPENRLLWRFNRRRLDFEAMRDSLLAVSGEMDSRVGGKAVDLFTDRGSPRRTIYGFLDRQFVPGVYRVFDFANPDLHTPQRSDTTVPQQALFFLNSPFLIERGRALAARAAVRAPDRPARRIERLYQLVYQRRPTEPQAEAAQRFIKHWEAEPRPEPPKPILSPWQYGYGEYDVPTDRVKDFRPLPHFTGEAWQGGPNWPDGQLGWVQLTREGGHTGNDLAHAAIRRWTAPRDCTVWITGVIAHAHNEGDGIRARVVSSRHGALRTWTLRHTHAEANFPSVTLERGDTLDFLVDLRDHLNSDMFTWAPRIRAEAGAAEGTTAEVAKEWDARNDFAGPPPTPPKPLDAWEKYAQVLLLANEFMFVD